MKTASQKYKRRHWYKFTNWQNVMWLTLAIAGLSAFFCTVFITANKHENQIEKNDSITDSVPATKTKDDTAKFDTIIDNTRIVIKTNRPVKIKVQ